MKSIKKGLEFIKKKKNYGFTLIELLVVIGILLILMALTLIAINPVENFNNTSDVAASAISNDFIKSNITYFTNQKSYPWDNDDNCKQEIEEGHSLYNMPSCLHKLANDGEFETDYKNNPEVKNIYARKCGEKVVVCYQPKSKKVNKDAKYDKYGVSNPGCPGHGGGEGCYWCKPLNNKGDCDGEPNPTPSISSNPTSSPTPTSTPTETPSPTTIFTPTPTQITQNCSTQQTVSLAQPSLSAVSGQTIANTLIIKNSNTGNCGSVFYTVSRGYPTGWVLGGIPNSFSLTTGETKNIDFTLTLPNSGLIAQDYIYQFWVAKQGQTIIDPVNGIISVAQASPTSTPLPSPTPNPSNAPGPSNPWGAAAVFHGKVGGQNPPTNKWINQFMEVTYDPKLNLTSNNVTVEAWIKPDLPTGLGYDYGIAQNEFTLTMDARQNGPDISYRYYFDVLSNMTNCGRTVVYTDMYNWYPWSLSGPPGPVNKTVTPSEFVKWKHIAGVMENGNLSIYENGIKLATYNIGMTVCKKDISFLVGARDNGPIFNAPWYYNFFQGAIDEVRISDIARYTSNFTPQKLPFTSDQHTKMLYHFDSNTQDSSSNNLNGTMVGSVYYVNSDIPSE